MTQYARFNVFGIVFGIAYIGFFLYSEFGKVALFRYYPVLGGFRTEALPIESAGPAILWYSWLLGGFVVASVASLLVPPRLADKLTDRWIWLVPTALLVGILIYERRWFY